MKPIIGIVANYTDDDSIGLNKGIGARGQDWQILANDYIKAIEKAGGCPVIIPIVRDLDTIQSMIDKIDGILFSGGSDISPNFYGELPRHGLGSVCPQRDLHEICLAKKVLTEMDIPILGICRGMQLLTVVTGGTLYQDLERERPESFKHALVNFPKDYPSHEVRIQRNSKLYSIFCKEYVYLNSFHHQAVKKLGNGFYGTMFAPDGLIEGIEMPGNRFVIALQGHPEMMVDNHPEFLRVFEAFVEASTK